MYSLIKPPDGSGGSDAGLREAVDQLFLRARAARPLNPFIHFDAAALLAEARRLAQLPVGRRESLALFGVPFVVKDNIDTANMPTSAGTPALRGQVPRRNAPTVQRLLDAGALLAGKTNMHELAFGITSNNAAFGAVRNPYDPNRIAGGSSGGTAAAIAAGVVEVGLGTDTGGSVRIPAALCGIVGFRPTMGRYEAAGMVPLSHTRDTVGVMAKNVHLVRQFDAVLALNTMETDPKPLSTVRLGAPRTWFQEGLHKDVGACLARALKLLAEAGATIVAADLPDIGRLNEATSMPVVMYEVVRDLARYLSEREATSLQALVRQVASPDVAEAMRAAMGGVVSEEVYNEAIAVYRPALQAAYRDYFRKHRLAALLVATTPLPACAVGEDQSTLLNGREVPVFQTYIRHTDPPSNSGLPAISLPAGLSAAGLPIGVELVAPAGSDEGLLQLAATVADILGPLPQPPSLDTA